VDGNGSGSCPVAGFGISGVEPWGSATTVLVSKMDLNEMGCEDGRWMELAQDHVQWQALVLAVLNLGVLLPQCLFVCLFVSKVKLILGKLFVRVGGGDNIR
jgi:hypothetical protein